MDFFDRTLFDIPIKLLALALLFIVGGFTLKRIVAVGVGRLKKVSNKTDTAYDGIVLTAIDVPLRWGCALGGIWLALGILPIPSEPVDIARFVNALLRSGSVILLTMFGVGLINGLAEQWAEHANTTDSRLDDQMIPILRSSGKVFVIILGGLVILQTLGYSITSLITGLGLGGAALALASKDSLANLFGSLVIFLDRPFQIGDWIQMSTIEGIVEEVGLRTTRVRTFSNSLVTVPNMLFTTSTITNWSKMEKRRFRVTFNIAYHTPPDQIRAAVKALREMIAKDDRFHHDFYLVNFDAVNSHALDIFIHAFARTTNWAEFMQLKEDFLLDALHLFATLDVTLALPTQRITLQNPGEMRPA